MRTDLEPSYRRQSGLVDVLDRVLDKGLVVAGDIKVSLAEVELLTIRIRLLVCSIDKAEQIGLNWWRYDTHLSGNQRALLEENAALREQVGMLEERLARLERGQEPKAKASVPERKAPAARRAAQRGGERGR